MTSSDETAIDARAVAAAGKRVGRSYVGDPGAGAAKVAIVAAKFNGGITQRLLEGALEAFEAHGISSEVLSIAWVPGAFEIPLAASRFASSGESSVVLALGAVIRGDTPHFDFVAGECASGCRQVALSTGVPVVFGVLTTDTVDQALERSAPGKDNRGYEAAVTALEMCDLLSRLPGLPVKAV
jgi:6,7-dimethyl-8-ribityllumazine synthase